MGGRRRALLASLLAVLVLVTACGGDDAPFAGHVLDNPYQVPDVDLTDTDGQPFSLAADTTDPLTLVFFGYTHCEDVCPAVLSHLASAMTRLDERDRDEVQVVMVSSDPDHDTEDLIRSYLDGFDKSFIGLRSDFATTAEVGRALAVGIDRNDPGGHTTQVMGIDPQDQAPVYWDSDTTASEFADDIHSLLKDT